MSAITVGVIILTLSGCGRHRIPSYADVAESESLAVLLPLAEHVSWNDDGNVRSIDLGGAAIGDIELASIGELHQLEDLNLGGSGITDAGMIRLANFHHLKSLSLAWTAVSDDGLRYLIELENITVLDLSGTRISDAGLETLRGLANLKHLFLAGTHVTEQGATEFNAAMPACRLQR